MPDAGAFHHVTLSVTDAEASAAWYSRALNGEVVARREGDGWRRVLVRSRGGVVVGLSQHDVTSADDRFDPARVGLDHLSVACRDAAEVEAWRSQLAAAGVETGAIRREAYGTTVVAKDPDGIPVEFFAPGG
ncbi:MAG: VOC family protein [Actinomycetota bacterium]|nr:VOC family protein [Actinomycetota bacterium]MDH4354250.1 VOC family protein [Actinomycetota bacterium]